MAARRAGLAGLGTSWPIVWGDQLFVISPNGTSTDVWLLYTWFGNGGSWIAGSEMPLPLLQR